MVHPMHLSTLVILVLSHSLRSTTSTPPSDLVAHLNPRAQAPAVAAAAPVVPAAPVAPVVPPVAVPPPAVPAGGAGAAAPPPPAPVQVPTVTTVMINTEVNGVPARVTITFTQTFKGVISQGPQPEEGTIGLGTLTGALKGKATAR